MKKYLALLFAVILLAAAGCAPSAPAAAQTTAAPATTVSATASPAATPSPDATQSAAATATAADSNLAALLGKTRKDVDALYGAGKAVTFSDLSDFTESSYEISGFPYEYSTLNGVQFFYDAKAPADDAAPYTAKEAAEDRVLGIALPAASAPYNVNGAAGKLAAADVDALAKDHSAKQEHINGMYEYYKIAYVDGGLQFIWHSDTADMANAVLFVQPAGPDATKAPTAEISGLILVVPGLPKDVEVISNESNPDGTYREELMYDGMVQIVTERLATGAVDAKSMQKRIDELNTVDSAEFKMKKDDALTTRLTYPAWRITYTTGENEDTRTNLDILVQTDGWDFLFHTSTGGDGGEEDYNATIETWIETLAIEEAGK